jgi:O-antigen/teichoic acid export membrane protein
MNLLKNRMVQNAGWLIFGKVVHMLLSFVIGLLTARYLGPNNYGLINYATAYATFFTSFCTLGINSVIVKNFIDHPFEEGETIGTTLVLRLISSFLSLCTIVGIVKLIDGTEPLTLVVVALYCMSLVFHVFDTFNYWFQSKLLSKYYALATLVSYLIASAYRVFLLMSGKSVQWFAIANSIDYCVVAFLLYLFYKLNHGPKLLFSIRKAKELLSVSCSYILSGLMVAIYGATDKLMLKQMLDEASVGYYALALSISTMWVFILSAVIDSIKPTIMRYHNENKLLYEKMNRKLYAMIFYLSFFASLFIAVIAPVFIRLIYGEDYLPAVAPLRIVVWYTAFSYLGVARDIWIVCERKQMYLKYLYIGSAAMNVLLNFIMIPHLGVNGAALATLITQISTIFLFPFFIKGFKPNIRIMLDAIMLKGILKPNNPER